MYLCLSKHIYVLSHKTAPRQTRTCSMSNFGKIHYICSFMLTRWTRTWFILCLMSGKKSLYIINFHYTMNGNRPIHTEYKEKACMYLNLIPFYVSAYKFMFYIPKQRHGRHGHGYLYAPCQIFEKFSICVLFCLHGGHRHGSFYVSCQEKITIYNQFSLHNKHGTCGFLHKQYKEKTCEYLYLIPIYLLAYIFMS